jgi:hypothetical protein
MPSSLAGTETVHEHLQSLNTRICSKISQVAEENIKKIQKEYELSSSRLLRTLTEQTNQSVQTSKRKKTFPVTAVSATTRFALQKRKNSK